MLALVASSMLASGVLAANNRSVYFGTPASDGGSGGGYTAGGQLIFGTLAGETKVTAGGRTAVTVLIENTGGQTLNHVKLAGGTTADAKPDNALFPPPSGTSLPAGASIAAVAPSRASTTCNPASGSGFECAVGQLAGGASVTFTVVINVPAATGAYPYWLTASWNEGWSSTGTNADYNFATGTLTVDEASCDNGQASWFLGTENVNLGDGSTTPCGNQDAKIKSGAVLGGIGGHAALSIDGSFAVSCPAGYKCFGKTIQATVIDGDDVPGGVEWTATWYGTKTVKGVLHFADDYATSGTFTAIPLTKQFQCSSKLTTDCWKSVKTSKGNVSPSWVEVVFLTESNGKGGGFL